MKLVEKKFGRHKAKNEEKVFGMADHDEKSRQVILIDPRQTERERLDTLLHEALHHACPWLSEEAVTRIANKLSKAAWKDDWRRVKQ